MRRINCGALLFLIAAVLLPFIAGCGSDPLRPTTLADSYPGDIADVDYIEILDGNSGERRRITDPAIIGKWIAAVRNLRLVPDPDQGERDGFSYSAALYEGDRRRLSLTPNNVQGTYYHYNEQMHEQLEALFAQGHPMQGGLE